MSENSHMSEELTTMHESCRNNEQKRNNIQNKKEKFSLIDSESDNDKELNLETTQETFSEVEHFRKPMTLRKNYIILSDEEVEEQEPDLVEKFICSSKKRICTLVDSDDTHSKDRSVLDDNKNMVEHEHPTEEVNSNKERSKEQPKLKALVMEPTDDMQGVQSKQQRLHREAYVSVPYHKPKKQTLEDFLKRHAIVKPQLDIESNMPDPIVQGKNLKMTAEELTEYAKEMEDRAKEAAGFFKSNDKDTEIELDEAKCNKVSAKRKEETNLLPKNDKMQIETCSSDVEKTTHNKVVITEIIELPKIDLSTMHITPSLKPPTTSKLTESLQRLITDHKISNRPLLQGNENMLINLDAGALVPKPKTTVNTLLQRLTPMNRSRKLKNAKAEDVSIVEDHKSGLCNNNAHLEKAHTNKLHKPGEAYFKLKENLKKLMIKKRVKGMQNRQNYNENEDCIDGDTLKDNDNLTDEEDTNKEGGMDSSSEGEDETKGYKESIADITDEEEIFNLMETDETVSTGVNEENTDDEKNEKLPESSIVNVKMNETFEVKGQLDVTKSSDAIISQIPITQKLTQQAETDELVGLCSGTFETEEIDTQESDSIENSDEHTIKTIKTQRVKRFSKKLKKRQIKLGFSDDEDETESTFRTDIKSIESFIPTAENRDVYVDYDSEENEVVIEMTKKECLAQAEKFFEKEAELSESDWGSADEDERDLDKYDIELGDEDEFDSEKLQRELGQIHARKMLDADIKEVNKLQELFCEDEEVEGARQRQFKWKKDGNSFILEDTNLPMENANAAAYASGDEDNEQLLRKLRFERDQLLKEQSFKKVPQDSLETSSLNEHTVLKAQSANSSISKAPTVHDSVEKINDKKLCSTTNTTHDKKDSLFLVANNLNNMQEKTRLRNSFLLRDKDTLAKIAGLIKSTGNVDDETAGTVLVPRGKAQNFVFATLTAEEHEIKKRKLAEVLNSSSENGIGTKKPKIAPRKNKCFIDKLL